MSMEIRDEAIGRAAAAAAAANNNNNSSSSATSGCSHPVVKGKRTKRQRVHQSPATAAASSTSSSSGDLSGTATEEDEDMANCLILLAQGRTEQLAAGPKSEATALQKEYCSDERLTSRRLAETATTNGKPGFYIYECKTCNKCFQSFQALGGHRSSHKKLKMVPTAETDATTEEKVAAVEEDNTQVSVRVSNPTILSGNNTTTIGAAATAALTSSTNNNNNGSNNNNNNNKNNSGVSNLNKPRVHECSICGSEFSSGQALGGHMRRHRPAAAVEITKEAKKEKSILSLDLNLPAPAENDHGDYVMSPSFPFSGGQPLLFSPSALVDCHY